MAGQFRDEKVSEFRTGYRDTEKTETYPRFWLPIIRYDDQYTLTLTLKDNKGIRAATITKSCASYIDNNGVVLENLVANEVGRLYNSLNAGKKDK